MNKKLVARNGTILSLVVGTGLYALVAGAAPGTQVAITRQTIEIAGAAHKADATTAMQSWSPTRVLDNISEYYCSQNRTTGVFRCRLVDNRRSRITSLSDTDKVTLLRSGKLRSAGEDIEQVLDAAMVAAHDAWAARCDGAASMAQINDIRIADNGDGTYTTTCHPIEVLTSSEYVAKSCEQLEDCAACTKDEDCAAEFSCGNSECLPDQPIVKDIGEVVCADDTACIEPATCNTITGQCE